MQPGRGASRPPLPRPRRTLWPSALQRRNGRGPRDRARHALGGLGRRHRAGAGRPVPGALLDRGRHVRSRRAAHHGGAARPGAGRRPANSSAAPASRCRSRAAAGAYVPGILTAAGAFTLFGAVYAAHGVYGFIGPVLAFILLGLVGVVTIAAALVHGQALAGLGLLGAMLTPAAGLVAVAQRLGAVRLSGDRACRQHGHCPPARLDLHRIGGLRRRRHSGACSTCSDSGEHQPLGRRCSSMPSSSAAVRLLWLARRPADDASGIDRATVSAAFFVALASAQLLVDPELQLAGRRAHCGGLLLAAMVLIAVLQRAGPADALRRRRGGAAGVAAHCLAGHLHPVGCRRTRSCSTACRHCPSARSC